MGEDDMLLDFLDDNGPSEKKQGGNRPNKHKKIKKWGKKGRKLRNPDPYGCHTSPDDDTTMYSYDTPSGSGLMVKAGKKHSGGNDYTRPTSYGGIGRGAAAANRSTKKKSFQNFRQVNAIYNIFLPPPSFYAHKLWET